VTRPHSKLLNGLVLAPAMQLRQTVEGRLVAAAHFDGTGPGDDGAAAAIKLFDAMKGMISSGASLTLDCHRLGHRPVPKDGFPPLGASRALQGFTSP
jgi:hypothetical protein